jgi:hypothetical protein
VVLWQQRPWSEPPMWKGDDRQWWWVVSIGWFYFAWTTWVRIDGRDMPARYRRISLGAFEITYQATQYDGMHHHLSLGWLHFVWVT